MAGGKMRTYRPDRQTGKGLGLVLGLCLGLGLRLRLGLAGQLHRSAFYTVPEKNKIIKKYKK